MKNEKCIINLNSSILDKKNPIYKNHHPQYLCRVLLMSFVGLFLVQRLQAQNFGLQTTSNPPISTYAAMLSDERVVEPFYGPIKAIHASAVQNKVVCTYIGDIHKGTWPKKITLVGDESEYEFSKNGQLHSIIVYNKQKIDYFTYKSGGWLEELAKNENWSSKVLDGSVSYKFQNGLLTEKKDVFNKEVKIELAFYDSLGRVISYRKRNTSSASVLASTDRRDTFLYNDDGLLKRHYNINVEDQKTTISGFEFFVYSKALLTNRFVYRKSIYTFIENQPVYRHYFYLSVLDYDTLADGHVKSDTRVLFYEMKLSEEEERRIYSDDGFVASLIDSVYEKGEEYIWMEDRCRNSAYEWTIPYNVGSCTYDSLGNITRWHNKYRAFRTVENISATMRYDEKSRLIEAVADTGMFVNWQKKIVRQKAEYDNYGNLRLFEYFEEGQNEPSLQKRYEYDYDTYGNWVSRKYYLNGELTSDEKRVIEYW